MPIAIQDLLSDDDDERYAAQTALAQASDAERQKLLAPLRTALDERVAKLDDEAPWTHVATAMLLLRSPEADAVVAALATHPDEDVRRSLVSVHAERGPLPAAIAALAGDPSYRVRKRVYSKLAEEPTAYAVAILLTQAATANGEDDLLKALGACARVATPEDRAKADAVLTPALDAAEDELRESAISAFSHLRSASPEAREKLKKLAAAERPQTRWAAVGALAAVGDDTEARLARLIEAGSEGDDSEDAACAGTTLAYDVDPALSVPAYERAMAHATPRVRAFAVTDVTFSPDKRARLDLGKVEALLADPDDDVRAAAAAAAAEIVEHKERFAPRLQQLLEDRSRKVKRAAKEALETLDAG